MATVLVTGGAGFIGSHLSEALLARGDQVLVIDDESTGRFENLAAVRSNPSLKLIRGSIGEAVQWATGREYEITETHCLAKGDEYCRFEIGEARA